MTSRTSITIGKTFYQLVVVSFVGVIMWVGWGIYQAIVVVPKPQIDAQMLSPVPSEFDEKVLNQIVSRVQLADTIDGLISESYVPTIVSSDSAIASPSGTTQ